jgi:aryl-alcohol dehydrogenase-like predicted oxidoreductase/spore coat polysaccharide biosynthesis protein SpsF (cytidylyltransferase family)
MTWCDAGSIVLLQARTTSSRLPAKVSLPIGGLPLSVLAAKRAGNTGKQVVVVTSADPSDDGLAALLQEHNVPCFRGSLNNVLDRMVSALTGLPGDTIVFRLTADNVFPDGALLEEMEAEFVQDHLDYLVCNGEPSGLPYGLSAEVTRVQHLRDALASDPSVFDQEHVTPCVIRKFGPRYFDKHKHLALGHFRATVDCLDDYLSALSAFATVRDPVTEPWQSLVKHLKTAPSQPTVPQPVSKLVLGTAQLGSAYGIANKTGLPAFKEAESLLKTAIVNGVTHIDTAHAYGASEAVIGQALKDGWAGRARVITKLALLENCPSNAPASVVNAFVDASVFQSCASLGVAKIDVMMLHRASHLRDWAGAAWNRLKSHQLSGRIGELGVSVQTPGELLVAIENPDVRYVQLPFNLLDWRWDDVIPRLQEVQSARQLTVHVRSALLQGLLPSTDTTLWRKANVDSPEAVIGWLREKSLACGRDNVVDLCLAYLTALPWVDGVALGMENLSQLNTNLKLLGGAPLSHQQLVELRASRPHLPETVLNPAQWRVNP